MSRVRLQPIVVAASRNRPLLAKVFVALLVCSTVIVATAPAWAKKDKEDDDKEACRPSQTSAKNGKAKGPKGSLPEFPGTVTTVCVGKHPTDVAIASDWGLAVVANREGRSLSMVDLRSNTVVGTVPLPARPTRVDADGSLAAVVSPWSPNLFLVDLSSPGFPVTTIPLPDGSADVAVDATQKLAVVLDRHRRQVNVVNFATSALTIGTLTLPKPANELVYSKSLGWAFLGSSKQKGLLFLVNISAFTPTLLQTKALPNAPGFTDPDGVTPAAIGINEATQDVLILDRDGSLLTYNAQIDLFGQTLSVVRGPLQDVKVDPVRNMAVVAGQNNDAFIVDLAARAPLYHVSVGRKPVGVAVNGDPSSTTAGTAAVANQDDNSLAVFTLPNAGLRVSALFPQAVAAGSQSFILTIQGTGFASSAKVQFGTTVVTSTFVNSNQLTASVPASLVTTAGTIQITVTVGTQISAPIQFTVYPPQNPVPTIIPPLLPGNVVAGTTPLDGFLPLTINGSHFVQVLQVTFSGTPVSYQFVSDTQIIALIPGTLLTTPGTVTVAVTNPPPGGGTSTAPFIIKAPGNPAGVITTTVDVGAHTSGVAVDPGIDTAVVTLPGDFLASPIVFDNRVQRLSNLTGILPGSPPTLAGLPITVGSTPEAVAVNPSTHIALTADFGDGTGPGTASLVNLVAGTLIGTAPVGLGPQGVAVDPTPANPGLYPKGIGVVTNNFDGTMTVIDLATAQQVALVSATDLGAPVGVAIHPGSHLAVVADQTYYPGDAVLVDLTDPLAPTVLKRIPVGLSPTRVAIDTTRNLAVVSNQDGNTASVINLVTRSVVATLNVGQQPFGVAIDEVSGIAAVVNRLDATLSLISLVTLQVVPPSVNLPFVPTEVVVVPGLVDSMRLLTTDVASNNIGVVNISRSILP